MTNKSSLILKYFQKAGQLTTQDSNYQKTITSLFKWLLDSDQYKDDRTTKLLELKTSITAQIISHDTGIIAGIDEVSYLIPKFSSLIIKAGKRDGEKVENGQIIAEISGLSREILSLERTVLNLLQRMSGIATETNKLIALINLQPTTHNPQLYIAATRKTPWGLLDKKAVTIGGGLTHRLNLGDGILIKDNHLAVFKKEFGLNSIDMAVSYALEISLRGPTLPGRVGPHQHNLIEIEVTTPDQAHIVLETFYKYSKLKNNNLAIMFDNFSPEQTRSTIRSLREKFDLNLVILEASGGINENNIRDWAKTGVDILSLGSLTHSSKTCNLSLEI
ncbi:nicotinate-nucleotide diphosphorylase (carboxylating) [Candidatus Gottesmanbacteria bacterium RIFCSPLOWO2_01_FULL_39_12b]|uniref:nicotinate-nucleotide diphosphorylase (carboxylating) n=1 Tax=Candidatus Gottesmanbacteria bacterium RIFCSPLOWO2_01_FULL_39_12b TaxID=1798388 RepID=A0A1F6AN99_9BACT|nr:MAG: nicotinate-nucleotide diphosphorylase (carboxylating) [Candidatus Gottesmanbacteria bacterium RIFCSPLOWO2_01_FULL_39_12b]